jgi:DNA-binding transcriptional LysR family regulator
VQLDLNLLTVLDALLTEGSVMGAADRLRLSSPAVSRSLGRIRRLTGDDIFVRTGRTMMPTPYALAIADQVGELVRQANSVLRPRRELDLTTLTRTFTVQCHDALTTALAPPLLDATVAEAPNVRLRFLPETAVDTDDLRHGRVDLQIGATVPEPPEIRSETFGHDRLVVVLRATHPYAQGLDLAAYAAQPHVLISRRGRLNDPIDEMLATHGLHRTVLAAVGSTAAAAHIAARGNALLTASAVMCQPLINAFGLVTRPLPEPLMTPPLPIVGTWHQRYDTDAGHAWLRDHTRLTLQSILSAPSQRP